MLTYGLPGEVETWTEARRDLCEVSLDQSPKPEKVKMTHVEAWPEATRRSEQARDDRKPRCRGEPAVRRLAARRAHRREHRSNEPDLDRIGFGMFDEQLPGDHAHRPGQAGIEHHRTFGAMRAFGM